MLAVVCCSNIQVWNISEDADHVSTSTSIQCNVLQRNPGFKFLAILN